jgi:hypothetical protein
MCQRTSRSRRSLEIDHLLTDSPPGPAGWIIPIDPMLSVLRPAPQWQLLLELAARAA